MSSDCVVSLQWANLLAFRNTRVEADLGFSEYIVHCEHRESWQQNSALKESKATLSAFALELMKKMNIRYRAPPMPVEMTMRQSDAQALQFADFPPPRARTATDPADGNTDFDLESVEALFGKRMEI